MADSTTPINIIGYVAKGSAMVADLGEQELLSGQDSQSVSLKASSEKKREIKAGYLTPLLP